MGSDSAYGEPFYGEPADEVATLRERLAAAEAARREAEERLASERAEMDREAKEIMSSDIPFAQKAREASENFRLFQQQRDLAIEANRQRDAAVTALASERAAREKAERERDEINQRASELLDALDMALEKKVPDVRALRGAAFQQFWAWQEVSGHILYGEVEACIEEAFRLGTLAAVSRAERAEDLIQEALAEGRCGVEWGERALATIAGQEVRRG